MVWTPRRIAISERKMIPEIVKRYRARRALLRYCSGGIGSGRRYPNASVARSASVYIYIHLFPYDSFMELNANRGRTNTKSKHIRQCSRRIVYHMELARLEQEIPSGRSVAKCSTHTRGIGKQGVGIEETQ